jgi:hypothetical protein
MKDYNDTRAGLFLLLFQYSFNNMQDLHNESKGQGQRQNVYSLMLMLISLSFCSFIDVAI